MLPFVSCSVNFHTLPGQQHSPDEQAEGLTLQNACQTMFTTLGLRGGSRWQVANILIPFARPLVSLLARTFPDERLKMAVKVGEGGQEIVVGWGACVPT